MSLFGYFLDKLTNHWERKCKRKMGGIPLLWVIYQPQNPVPNIVFKLHPMFTGDQYLNQQFKEIADYMRSNYAELRDGGSP